VFVLLLDRIGSGVATQFADAAPALLIGKQFQFFSDCAPLLRDSDAR
jgi:hypothetical protein